MPKQSNQSLYNITGGALLGQGGFGCVFDLQDLTVLMTHPSISYGFDVQLNKGGGLTKGSRKQNSTSSKIKVNYDPNFITKSLSRQSSIGINDKNTDEAIYELMKQNTNTKVAKIFTDESSYQDEKKELMKIKSVFGDRYEELFPKFHQLGWISWEKGDTIGEKVVLGALPCTITRKGAIHGAHTFYFVIMDKMSYSLDAILKPKQNDSLLNLDDFAPKIIDLVSRMKLMHNEGVVHCDIKPQNILMNSNNIMYFTDLGGASHTSKFKKTGTRVSSSGFTVMYTPRANRTTEAKYDERLLVELNDNCMFFHISRILGIKNVSILLKTFRETKATIPQNTNNADNQDDILLYVDQFAMAITLMLFIKFYSNNWKDYMESKAIKDLEACAKMLFTTSGKISLNFKKNDLINSTDQIEHYCNTLFDGMVQKQQRLANSHMRKNNAHNEYRERVMNEVKGNKDNMDMLRALGMI